MGWASGSFLMSNVLRAINLYPANKVETYKMLIRAFEQEDCDTLYECLDDPSVDPVFIRAYYELYPEERA